MFHLSSTHFHHYGTHVNCVDACSRVGYMKSSCYRVDWDCAAVQCVLRNMLHDVLCIIGRALCYTCQAPSVAKHTKHQAWQELPGPWHDESGPQDMSRAWSLVYKEGSH